MWALNNNYPFKKYCNLWSNIGGVHEGTADRSGHPKLSWLYQTINFITTNCCQYSMIWCKCYPVINTFFNISCYKCFITYIIIFLSISWQGFACDHVGFITYMCRNRIYFCFPILLLLSRLLQFRLEWWDSSPLVPPPAMQQKDLRDIFFLC